ncbi:hypothetical protein N0V90_009011 [Kalmusia sp. IMI 367209]|nr:hypothetical protein N0V90_009011 [Kalmusia sp. IMI 367209]
MRPLTQRPGSAAGCRLLSNIKSPPLLILYLLALFTNDRPLTPEPYDARRKTPSVGKGGLASRDVCLRPRNQGDLVQEHERPCPVPDEPSGVVEKTTT